MNFRYSWFFFSSFFDHFYVIFFFFSLGRRQHNLRKYSCTVWEQVVWRMKKMYRRNGATIFSSFQSFKNGEFGGWIYPSSNTPNHHRIREFDLFCRYLNKKNLIVKNLVLKSQKTCFLIFTYLSWVLREMVVKTAFLIDIRA